MRKPKQTPEQAAAVEEWIKQVQPPEVAHDTIRAKFKRLNLTPEEIAHDMRAKLARIGGAK